MTRTQCLGSINLHKDHDSLGSLFCLEHIMGVNDSRMNGCLGPNYTVKINFIVFIQ